MTALSLTDIADAARLRRVDPAHYDWNRLGAIYRVPPAKIQAAVEPVMPTLPTFATPVWPLERVELMTRLWRRGASAGQVARALNDAKGEGLEDLPPITTAAVTSKLSRMGLAGGRSGHHTVVTLVEIQRQSRARSPGFSEDMLEQYDAPPSLRLSFDQLTDKTCRWPYGDPKQPDFHFCGHACCGVSMREPYCPRHKEIATIAGSSQFE